MRNLCRSAFLTLGLSVWMVLTAASLQGQPAASGQTGAASDAGPEITFHLHGTVVDGVSGKPVDRALVASQDRRLATMTDSSGAFALDIRFEGSLRDRMQTTGAFRDPKSSPEATAVRIYFTVQKPGYLTPSEPLSVAFEGTGSAVTFRIMPAAVVSGRVFADAGATPRNVAVTLLAHNAVNGERLWSSAGVQRTGAEGRFRFTNLRPGEYTVMSAEWRGDQPAPSQRNRVAQEYPPVFFGDTSSLASSTKLHVHYGEIAGTDLHLRLAAYYPVKVPVSGPANAGVNVRVNSADALDGFQLGYNAAEHAVEGALPSGTYALSLSTYGPQQAFGTAVLHVANAPLQTGPVALVPPAPITVRVREEFTEARNLPEHRSTRVVLQPEDRGGVFVNGAREPGQDGIVLRDVAPGRYTVRVETEYGYAASVQYAGVDLQAQPLAIGEGGATAPIDVTLRDDTGRLEGAVAGPGASLAETTFVCLVPLSPGGQLEVAPAGPDGKFALGHIVPGNYRLFATLRPPWGMPWHDPEVLRGLEGKGVAITATSKAVLQRDAPLLDDSAMELP